MASAAPSAADEAGAGPGARLAAFVLVALVVLSPWATGAVDPVPAQTVAVVSLATALAAVIWDTRRGVRWTTPLPLWPVAGLWLLAAMQLAPMPESLQHFLAPGPASVWHPAAPEAAAILGRGARPISVHPEATRRSVALATGILALGLAAVPALRDRRLLLRAAAAVVAGGVAVAVYALVARLVFGNKLYGVWSVPTVAPLGPFVNKNHFAGYVELVALLAMGLASGLASEARRGQDALAWIEGRRARVVVVVWGATAILVLAVAVSLSRGGVMSLCAGVAAFAGVRLWSRRGSRLTSGHLLAGSGGAAVLIAALVAVIPAESRSRVLSIAGVASEESGSFRLGVWRDTLRLVASSPWFGSGFGAFEDALPRFKTAAGYLAVQHAENDYLELLAEGGFVGGLLASALVGLVLARALHVGSARERLPRGLATGAFAGLVAIGVHSAFDFNLHIPSNALAAALLAATVLAVAGEQRPASSRATAVALSVALIVAAATPWVPTRIGAGTLLKAAGRPSASLRRADLERDLTSHIRRRPADATAWLAIAWLRLPESRKDAAGQGAWAVVLDPANDSVRTAAARLEGDPVTP
jgi:O-antigen ligase